MYKRQVFKETEELRDTINTTLKQTLKIQEEALVQQKESYQSTLASKAELLKDREDKIPVSYTHLHICDWNYYGGRHDSSTVEVHKQDLYKRQIQNFPKNLQSHLMP